MDKVMFLIMFSIVIVRTYFSNCPRNLDAERH